LVDAVDGNHWLFANLGVDQPLGLEEYTARSRLFINIFEQSGGIREHHV
jgi:hypothetical protein